MDTYGIDDRGFTLIELLLVIAIIATLSSISMLASKEMIRNYKLKGAARQLYSDMQYARISSIKGGKVWRLTFSADGSYVVAPRNPSATDKQKQTSIPADYKGVKICNFSNPSDPLEDVWFNPNGTSKGEQYKISNPDKSYKVHSLTGTGAVKIEKIAAAPCP